MGTSRKVSLALLALGCILAAVAGIGILTAGQNTDTMRAVKTGKRDIKSVVLAVGVAESSRAYPLVLAKNGRVTALSLREGMPVKDGQVLMQVDSRPIYAMNGQVPLLRTLRRGDSGEDVRELQASLERFGYLSGLVDGDFGLVTEEAVRAWQGDRSLPQTGEIGPDTMQFFPFPLVVSKILVAEGAPAGPGAAASLVDPRFMSVKANILALDVPSVKIGQKAVVYLDGLPGRKFEGVVEEFFRQPQIDDKQELVYPATIKLRRPPVDVSKTAQPATVIIKGHRVSGTLTVPSAAIKKLDGQTYVSVPKGRGVENRPVVTGVRSAQEIEIRSGLDVGDKVIIKGEPGMNVSDGRTYVIALTVGLFLVFLSTAWNFTGPGGGRERARPTAPDEARGTAWGALLNRLDQVTDEVSDLRKVFKALSLQAADVRRSRDGLQAGAAEIFKFAGMLGDSDAAQAIRGRLVQFMERNGLVLWEPAVGEEPPAGCEKVPLAAANYAEGLVAHVISPGFKTTEGEIILAPVVGVAAGAKKPLESAVRQGQANQFGE